MVLNIQFNFAHYRTKAHSQCCVLWDKRSPWSGWERWIYAQTWRERTLCSDWPGWCKEMIFVFCFRINVFYKKAFSIKFCFINIYAQSEFWITHIQNMTNDLWINYTNCSEKCLRINIPWGIFLLRIFILRYSFTRKMTFVMS